MMAGTQIVYKLQVHRKFLFAGYKDSGMEALQKIQEHPLTRLLQRSKKVQFRRYINRLNKINMCTRPQIIMGAANYPICFENCVVGHQGLKQFFEQNPEYYIRKQKPLAAERKHSHSVHNMSNYFETIGQVMGEKRITELDI